VIGPDDVLGAARVLDGVAHRTPVLSSAALDGMVGAHVVLKAECFQRAGAFKFRGAYNKVSSLEPAQRERGVVAYSSGNHAQGVALASRLVGAPATIVMPSDAPASKVEATRGYGAEVVVYDRFTEDREAIGAALAEERGLALVKPYDDPLIMAGQGTAALELLDDAGGLDVFVAPVGGGGLMAGCATVVRDRCPDARIVGVEPEAGDDYKRSLEAGRRITIEVPRTIADGQQLTTPGELTFEVNRRLVDEIVTVSDGQIVDAMRLLFERLKVVAEPSGACTLAALLAGKVDVPAGARVGLILSGGNVSAARFAELLAQSSKRE
jgi:threo-3-hydroxy-L-aspartate ammonia-lyase